MPDEEPDLAFDGGRPWSRKQILLQLNERLKMEPGVEYTRFEPSRIAPDTVITSLTPREFLGEAYPAAAATLAVWWSPRSTGRSSRWTVTSILLANQVAVNNGRGVSTGLPPTA